MKRRVNKWDTFSLRQKIVSTSVICLLVPLLISTAVSNYLSKDVLMENAVNNAQDAMKIVELNLAGLMNNILYITNYIQFDSEMNALLREGQTNDASAQNVLNYAKITSRLNSVTNLLNDIYITILTDSAGGYTNYSTYNHNFELFFKEPWFAQLQKQSAFETLWLGGQPNYMLSSQQDNPYLITIARKIQPSTTPLGYIIISLKESDFSKSFAQLTGSQELMLVDSEGTVLSHPDTSKIGQKFAYRDSIRYDQNDALVTSIAGEKYLLASHKLTYSDWSLVSLTRYKDANEKLNSIQRANLFIQVSFFSIFLIILIFFIRRSTKPLAKLGRVASEFETGNLSVRAHIEGNNEISKVGHSFDKMLDRIETMLNQIVQDQAKRRMLELETLQAQIHPHFLFNILNSIRLKILMKNDHENAALIQSLSHLLRMTINRNNEFIMLYQEIEVVNHYIKLMNMRQHKPIEFIVELTEQASMVEVPRLFIQPLIENAYIHGFNESGGKICIKASIQQQQLVITIVDNGNGMSEEQVNKLLTHLHNSGEESEAEEKYNIFSGIGMKNVYERLQLIYGPTVKLQLESELGVGTEVSLFIPIIAGEARYV
ncbi:sensor histidine kinase [Paenibacillus yanchengensis]|uniref:Sensor histidine kinase n=1 Tax=Paenibacillus yanchengensis TaxID=2035833 RepID=A0ABW4YL10_9BACL